MKDYDFTEIRITRQYTHTCVTVLNFLPLSLLEERERYVSEAIAPCIVICSRGIMLLKKNKMRGSSVGYI